MSNEVKNLLKVAKETNDPIALLQIARRLEDLGEADEAAKVYERAAQAEVA